MKRPTEFLDQTITMRELSKIIKARKKEHTDKIHHDAETIGGPMHGYSEWHQRVDMAEQIHNVWLAVVELVDKRKK